MQIVVHRGPAVDPGCLERGRDQGLNRFQPSLKCRSIYTPQPQLRVKTARAI